MSIEPDTLVLNSFILTIKQAIRDKKIPVNNPFTIITKSMEILEKVRGMSGKEKKAYIVNAIEAIARGDDGIFGTTDDLIPERVVLTLKTMIEQDMIGNAVQLVTDATKGKFDINTAQKTCLPIISNIMACIRRPK
jgi:hypothetical protein